MDEELYLHLLRDVDDIGVLEALCDQDKMGRFCDDLFGLARALNTELTGG